jgi:hypothetical protein
MNTQELNELMKDSAQDAIVYLSTIHGHDVTLCQKDLLIIDLILTKLAIDHLQEPLSDERLFTICNIFGAFGGELFKSIVGGEWFLDETIEGAPFVTLNYAGKSFAFASMCYEKLVKTPEVSIAKYYELAVGGFTQ